MAPGILQPLERLQGTRANRPEGLGASWDSLVLGRALEEPFTRKVSRAGCRNHRVPVHKGEGFQDGHSRERNQVALF